MCRGICEFSIFRKIYTELVNIVLIFFDGYYSIEISIKKNET